MQTNHFLRDIMIFQGAAMVDTTENRLAGYAFLIERYGVSVLPNWHTSSVSTTGMLRSTIREGQTDTVYPQSYWPGDRAGDHLEFAIKYDGVNLGILSALFEVVEADEITVWISSKPVGKYTRKVWFLYELLTGRELPLPDLTKGNYIALLESDRYYTASPGRRIRRHRIIDNLLGERAFCPIIRRTEKLADMERIDLRKRCEEIVTSYPPELLRRALSYLYTKETKSTFEIEHIKPSASRTEKFIGVLESAERGLLRQVAPDRRSKPHRRSQVSGCGLSDQPELHRPDDSLPEGTRSLHLPEACGSSGTDGRFARRPPYHA